LKIHYITEQSGKLHGVFKHRERGEDAEAAEISVNSVPSPRSLCLNTPADRKKVPI